MDEINKNLSVTNVQFIAPDIFKVKYEIQNTTADKIAASDIFKTFKVSIQ
jgi:hypothetical protein